MSLSGWPMQCAITGLEWWWLGATIYSWEAPPSVLLVGFSHALMLPFSLAVRFTEPIGPACMLSGEGAVVLSAEVGVAAAAA